MQQHSGSINSGSVRAAIRFAAVAAAVFYAATAHLTRGHEADFGKQWLAARLVATGQGRQLYDPATQRDELERHFPPDVIERGIWRTGIGGPTYPPTFAVVFAPLGWLSPGWAQWAVVQFSVLMVLVAARQIERVAGPSVTWETAALAVFAMPSFFLAIGVGQNSAMSLAIFAAGWSLLARERSLLAGVVWGLFALKPTWGIAVAWIPAVLGRPRAYLGMTATAAGLVLLSLPICGVQSWFDWLAVARQTEHLYETLPRWTALSRDLPGLFRRTGQGSGVELFGIGSLAAVLAVTVATWWTSRATSGITASGPRAAALLAGSLLSCPRFMFYDITLAALPVLLALAGWSRLRHSARWALVCAASFFYVGTVVSYVRWQMLGPPLETFAVIALWCWAVIETLRTRTISAQTAQPEPNADALAGSLVSRSA